jgi:DNA gyrase subunit B
MINVVSAIEAIRKRPGMYVGDVADGSGLHHMLDEAVNNALAEAWAGHCTRVHIVLNSDSSVIVRDDGRGIPTQIWRDEPIPQIVMTQLHCGGKFDSDTGEKPTELGGVGVVVVNALSERLELRIWRDTTEHYMRFERGDVEVPLKIIGETNQRGTELTFTPDPEIFGSLRFDISHIERRLRSLAHLRLGATISLIDKRSASSRKITLEV